MYISNIHIQNYRRFQSLSVDFKDGINILIGPNNSGKSNLLRALALIFDGKSQKQLTVDDFYNGITLGDLKKHSPKITVTVTLSQSNGEDLMGDEKTRKKMGKEARKTIKPYTLEVIQEKWYNLLEKKELK